MLCLDDMLHRYAAGMKHLQLSVALIDEDHVTRLMYNGDKWGQEVPSRVYEIGSVTKTFTAALLAKLLHEGCLRLEDSIEVYLPELRGYPHCPTILQLATHTSRLTNDIARSTTEAAQALEKRMAAFSGDHEKDCVYQYITEDDIIDQVRVLNNLENSEPLYDVMMRHGMRIGCHAGDDNHNGHPFDSTYNDSCGWYTVFLADSLEYDSIIKAMDEKNFYASNGPRIYEISVSDGEEGKSVHIECSPANKVFMYYGSKSPKYIRLPEGETATSFDLPMHPKSEYIRISVYDEKGNIANSRGFFRDEWEG